MKRIIALLLCVLLIGALFCGCGEKTYKDGTYTGQSAVFEGDEEGNGDGYGVVTLTIKDNKITACEFKTYEPDGTLKDENYGKVNGEVMNQDFYNKAQKAVQGSAQYASLFLESGSLNPTDVDAITGATYSYDQFTDAVWSALEQAEE